MASVDSQSESTRSTPSDAQRRGTSPADALSESHAAAAATNGADALGEHAVNQPPKKRGVPEGLWLKCPGCAASVYRKEVVARLSVCPKCDYHFYVSAIERVAQVLDDGTFEPMNEHLQPTDPLQFADRRPYAQRLVAEQKRTGLSDAVLTGTGMVRARRVAFAVTDSAFIMGSMGSVVGERLARLV